MEQPIIVDVEANETSPSHPHVTFESTPNDLGHSQPVEAPHDHKAQHVEETHHVQVKSHEHSQEADKSHELQEQLINHPETAHEHDEKHHQSNVQEPHNKHEHSKDAKIEHQTVVTEAHVPSHKSENKIKSSGGIKVQTLSADPLASLVPAPQHKHEETKTASKPLETKPFEDLNFASVGKTGEIGHINEETLVNDKESNPRYPSLVEPADIVEKQNEKEDHTEEKGDKKVQALISEDLEQNTEGLPITSMGKTEENQQQNGKKAKNSKKDSKGGAACATCKLF